jgi:DNA anti-recombination protein RmuC
MISEEPRQSAHKTIRPADHLSPGAEKHLCIDSSSRLEAIKSCLRPAKRQSLVEQIQKRIAATQSAGPGRLRHRGVTRLILLFIPSDGIFAFVQVHLFDVVESAYRANVIIVRLRPCSRSWPRQTIAA